MELGEVSIDEADGGCLAEFATVMVDAFAAEGINAYAYDFARGGTLRARRRAARVELLSFLQTGALILVARRGGRIVGGAIVDKNARKSFGSRLRHTPRWFLAALPLLPAVRWDRLLEVRRATSLTQPIVGAYYTLAAVAVHPDVQGRGIGRMLLQTVHAFCEKDPIALGVYLYTGDRKNRMMYEREGYETLEVRKTGTLTVYHMFRTNGAHRVALDVNE